jgi:hypothetical protein
VRLALHDDARFLAGERVADPCRLVERSIVDQADFPVPRLPAKTLGTTLEYRPRSALLVECGMTTETAIGSLGGTMSATRGVRPVRESVADLGERFLSRSAL